MPFRLVDGDLLSQPVDAIVNSWNRNIIPWWLLIPQGVSGAIKRQAGLAPFRELGRMGAIPLGGAVITQAGRLPYRAIIHVAGIDMWWRASAASIRDSVRNALSLAAEHQLSRLAVPLIGAGSGGFDEQRAEALIVAELERDCQGADVTVVRFRAAAAAKPATT